MKSDSSKIFLHIGDLLEFKKGGKIYKGIVTAFSSHFVAYTWVCMKLSFDSKNSYNECFYLKKK